MPNFTGCNHNEIPFRAARPCGVTKSHASPADCADAPGTNYFTNPLCIQADPWYIQYQGKYLACFARDNRIVIHESPSLTVLGPPRVVWSAPAHGLAHDEVWAPELHLLDHRWYIYFAASNGENKNHRAWVLQSADANPLGPYTLHGPLYTGDDPSLSLSNRWAIDMTILELKGKRYAIWSGWQDERDIQHLFIAPMKNPLEIAPPRTLLCANDDYQWERVSEDSGERGLNEAPEILQHDGHTFLCYSCSGSWQVSYKIGLLKLKDGGDPLRPADWTKLPQPVFQGNRRTWGVGHNSFVKSPDGTQDWLVYHAKLDREEGWRRAVFAQPFTWKADGLPDFGEPIAAHTPLLLPSGETYTPHAALSR